MNEIKTILFATDFSESSDFSIKHALMFAKKFDAQLHILHVVNEPVDLSGFYVPHISFDKLEEEIAEGARKMMDNFCRTHLGGFDRYQTSVISGVPFNVILDKAKELQADLIIMGTHGRTGLDHVLFGSTAEKVVRKSEIPVLTVRIEE